MVSLVPRRFFAIRKVWHARLRGGGNAQHNAKCLVLLIILNITFAAQLAWMYLLVVIFRSIDVLLGGQLVMAIVLNSLLWQTSASLCKNENGICTQAVGKVLLL